MIDGEVAVRRRCCGVEQDKMYKKVAGGVGAWQVSEERREGLNRGSVGVGGFYSGETDKAAAGAKAAALSPIGVALPLLPVPVATSTPPARRHCAGLCLLPWPVSCVRGGSVQVQCSGATALVLGA